jgi:hypothetical protein
MIEVAYLDENHNFVSSEEATWKVVTEYDSSGKLLDDRWYLLRVIKDGKDRSGRRHAPVS